MVEIIPPPPGEKPKPMFHILGKGTKIVRIFNPQPYNIQALTFRYFGSIGRSLNCSLFIVHCSLLYY